MNKKFTDEELNNLMLKNINIKDILGTLLILYGSYQIYLDKKYDLYSMDTSTWD